MGELPKGTNIDDNLALMKAAVESNLPQKVEQQAKEIERLQKIIKGLREQQEELEDYIYTIFISISKNLDLEDSKYILKDFIKI